MVPDVLRSSVWEQNKLDEHLFLFNPAARLIMFSRFSQTTQCIS